MSASSVALNYVNYLWDDAKAAKLSPAEQLVYRSNLLGSDQRITNTGAATRPRSWRSAIHLPVNVWKCSG